LHGEAIALGMDLELFLSQCYNGLIVDQALEAQLHIQKIYGDLDIDKWNTDFLIDYMRKDKKNVNGKISFSLLSKIGHCNPDQFLEEEKLKAILAAWQQP